MNDNVWSPEFRLRLIADIAEAQLVHGFLHQQKWELVRSIATLPDHVLDSNKEYMREWQEECMKGPDDEHGQ